MQFYILYSFFYYYFKQNGDIFYIQTTMVGDESIGGASTIFPFFFLTFPY